MDPGLSSRIRFAGAALALFLTVFGVTAQAGTSGADPAASDAGPARLPSCAELATDPIYGLAGNDSISKLTATVVTAGDPSAKDTVHPTNFAEIMERGAPPTAAYCRVDFVYSGHGKGAEDGYDDNQRQAIGIRVGLPLRVDDGGTPTGWNGRIQNLGGGGCMGYLGSVTQATNRGYVGTASDGGHGAPYILFNCDFGVIQDKQDRKSVV